MTAQVTAPRAKRATIPGLLFTAFVLIAALTFFMPFKPNLPRHGLDSSWTFAINHAFEKGLVFGRDFVFTFGPFGFVFTKAWTPALGWVLAASCAYVAVAFATALLVLSRGRVRVWTVILLVVLSLVPLSMDGLLYAYPFFVGLICSQAVLRDQSPTGRPSIDLMLIAFLFSVVGLLPLVKGTLLIVCALVTGMAAVFLVINRRLSWAVTAIAAAASALVAFWLAAGQPIGALPAYFTSMSQIVAGYTDAMSVKGNTGEVVAYIVASLFVLASLYFSDRRLSSVNLFVFALFGLILFLAFKASFVRHDSHALTGMTVLIVCLAALRFVDKTKYFWTVAGFSALASTAMFLGCSFLLEPGQALFSNYVNMAESLAHGHPGEYDRSVRGVRHDGPMSHASGGSDVYPVDQNDLFAADNRWAPRPVPQSYSAYTPKLAELNAQHLTSPNAPDNLFLSFDPIDNRLPTLEDGPSLAVMLQNDHPVGFDHKFLVLNRNARVRPWSPPAPKVARTAQIGQVVDVPDLGSPVFAQIDMRRTLAGKIEEVLFKPSELTITVVLTDGDQKSYRFIPGMAQAGFIVSPWIGSTGEFNALFDPRSANWLVGVQSFKIEAADPSLRSWARTFAVRFAPLSSARPASTNPVTVVGTEDCNGRMDAVDLTPSQIAVRGWAARRGPPASPLREVYVTRTDPSGKTQFFPARPVLRPDVSDAFKNPDLAQSGFEARMKVSPPPGRYSIGVGYRRSGDQAVTCRQLQASLDVPARR